MSSTGHWRTVRKVALGIALGVLALVFTAVGMVVKAVFWSGIKDVGGDQIQALPPVPKVTLPGSQSVYVALGDSYSAGEGVEPYMTGTQDADEGGDRCHRSSDAYSQQMEFSTPVVVRFRACSGARIRDMYATQTTSGGGSSLGPQLAPEVLGDDVGLVTLTIGGNDLGFAKVLHHCFTHRDCMNDEFDDSFDDGQKSGLRLREWAERRLGELGEDMRTLFTRLRDGAPNSRILVLGYPNLLWSSWPDLLAKDCALDVLLLDGNEANEILEFQFRFDQLIDALSARTRVEFINTAPVFINHEPCGAVTPRWLDFIVPGDSRQNPLDPGTMHPNRNGHYVLSRVVACYLWQNPAPVDDYDGGDLKDCATHGKVDREPVVPR